MTSTASRLCILAESVASILRQTYPLTELNLWLSPESYLGDSGVSWGLAPDALKRLTDDSRLRIRWTRNTGPYRKLLPLLRERWQDRHCMIVTADDDVVYPDHWLDGLVKRAEEHPEEVVAYRTHEMRFAGSELQPYAAWRPLSRFSVRVSKLYFPTGRDGVLYRPSFFTERVFDETLYARLCPTNDDIWFRANTLSGGIAVVRVERHHEDFKGIPHEGPTLWQVNSKTNDAMIRDVFSAFGLSKANIMGDVPLTARVPTAILPVERLLTNLRLRLRELGKSAS